MFKEGSRNCGIEFELAPTFKGFELWFRKSVSQQFDVNKKSLL